MQGQVKDVMTREVITMGADAPVGQIASLLDREGTSAAVGSSRAPVPAGSWPPRPASGR